MNVSIASSSASTTFAVVNDGEGTAIATTMADAFGRMVRIHWDRKGGGVGNEEQAVSGRWLQAVGHALSLGDLQ